MAIEMPGTASPPRRPRVWCRTIGGLALFEDEQCTRLLAEAGKPLALLAYLALTPRQRANRDHVATLLWPNAPTPDARHSLRQSLYRLKQCANGHDLVTADGPDLLLGPGVRVDALEGEQLAAQDPERAYALLRGALFEDISFEDAKEFERWIEAERTRFQGLRVQVGQALAERCLAEGNPHGALDLAEELVPIHPFDEAPLRLLMAALASLGRHASAVARFHAWADLARREFEVEVSQSLSAYADQLEEYLRVRRELPAGSLPFVGRESQWAQLEAAWHQAEQGAGSVVLVEGAAGLGKTRLVEEFARRVRTGQHLVLSAKCSELEREVPYGVLAELLVGLTTRPELSGLSPSWLGEAARLLPELYDRFPHLPPQSDTPGSQAVKRRLHQALARCVEVVAEELPVALVLDDLHWADGPTLEVLHLLSQRAAKVRLMLVASYRPAELSPVARQFARAIVADQGTRLLLIDPLPEAAVGRLLDAMGRFDEAVPRDSIVGHLWRQSGGNPLLLGEMLDALARDRVLVAADGRWVMDAAPGLETLPHTLGKLMSDRVERLEPWMRACIETIAVAGQPVLSEVLARALDISEPRLELALAVLGEERLVRRVDSGMTELVHDELRRLVYQGIPDDRRRLLHLAIGQSLETSGEAKRQGGASRLGHHFDQAGDRERAHRYALLAAGEAGALGAAEARAAALELAEAHAPRALPPGSAQSREHGRRRRIRRAGAAAAGLAVLTAGAVLGSRLSGGAGDAGYAQGRLYLAPDAVTTGAGYVVEWPRWYRPRARIVALEEFPRDLPPPLFIKAVSADGERHDKVFMLDGRDTIQLTDGNSDDGGLGWLPDGRELTVHRGWRDTGGWYRQNVFLLNPRTRALRPVTDSRYQDVAPAWSPMGTRFAFNRDSVGQSSLWLADADGSHLENLSERCGLPKAHAVSAFSPDGGRVAVHFEGLGPGQSGSLRVIDLVTCESHSVGGPVIGVRPLWSPDGRWIAYMAPAGNRHTLRVVPADNSRPPLVVDTIPGNGSLGSWTGSGGNHVAEVRISGPGVLGVDRGQRLGAIITSATGARMDLPLRWQILDTTIARVDSLGFVKGRAPGRVAVIGSAGGFRADTMSLTVIATAAETLFVEDWRRGLDTARWRPFGSPTPRVLSSPAWGGGPAFHNNGDFNHLSGAETIERFRLDSTGFTLEAAAWAPLTGEYYQTWALGVGAADGPWQEYSAAGLGVHFEGSSPAAAGRLSCHVSATELSGLRLGGRRWHVAAVQLRPDSVLECWLDGRLVGQSRLPDAYTARSVSLLIAGRSVGTTILHGRVVVLRGLKY